MKTMRILNVLILVFSLLIVNSSPVMAGPPPSIPSSFWGTVQIDGNDAPVGVVISAWINGVKYAQKNAVLLIGETRYSIDVPADDPSTIGIIEGGKTNDTIIFKIGNLQATPSSHWVVDNSELNISATTPTCYALTLSYTGQGSDPTASPTNSADCGTGQYVAGASIDLSGAVPATDWQISGWSGTTNDISTASTNTVTMPASIHTASVNYTAIPINQAPVAVNDAYEVDEGAALNVITSAGVLANDTDPENDNLTAVKVSDPTKGILVLNSDGGFTYTPGAGQNGTDSFTYKAMDSHASESNIATVTINIRTVVTIDPLAMTSIEPNRIAYGYKYDFTLTVTGTGFTNSSSPSKVFWNDIELPTTFVNSGKLTALVNHNYLPTHLHSNVPVIFPITVRDGSTVGPLNFTVNKNPKPALVSSDIPGSTIVIRTSGFKVTVTGTGFSYNSYITWKGRKLPTTFISSTQLSADILSSTLLSTGTTHLQVKTPGPGGGSSVAMHIYLIHPTPVLSQATVTSTTTGLPITLSLLGTSLERDAHIIINGKAYHANHRYTFSTMQLHLPKSIYKTPGVYTVYVVNPLPGGGTTASQTFTLTAPVLGP